MKKMKILCSQSQTDRQTDRQTVRLQRMRNIIAILALFVCTSICLGDRVIVKKHGDNAGMDYNYTANVDHPYGLVLGGVSHSWKPPVNCILDIVCIGDGRPEDDSRDARISFACGAYMCNIDRNIDSNDIASGAIQGPMTGNKVNVHTGRFKDSRIAGAFSYDVSAKVDNNEVTITHIVDGNIGYVFGGHAYDTSASSNTVTISDVSIGTNANGGRVTGGYVQNDGYARDNKVIINGTASVKGFVCGGYIEKNGTATKNEVHLTSVTVSSNVYGARIKNGLAEDNKVIINGTASVKGFVFGGYIEEKGTATKNEVHLTSVTVSSNVYGARIKNGLAEDNKVIINGTASVKGFVFGGYIEEKGTVSSNTVTITSGAVHAVYGGYIGQKGTATLNEVNLTSVTVSSDVLERGLEMD